MKFSVTEKLSNDGGVVLTQHPPVIASLKIKAGAGALKSGTILKTGTDGYEAALAADAPEVVLVENVEAKTGEETVARCLLHGCVAVGRLFERLADGSDKSAGDVLVGKLSAKGIYPMQAF